VLYEKKLNSFAELIEELGNLDLDAGIRAAGKLNSKKCFVFVTRSANGFTSMLYSIKTAQKESFPEKRLLAKEFPDLEQAKEFLNKVVVKPVKAFSY
jgi:hypothetical protein